MFHPHPPSHSPASTQAQPDDNQLEFDFVPCRPAQPASTASCKTPVCLPALGAPRSRLIDRQAGTHRVIIYCAGSRALESFLRPLELVAYKIGVTGAVSAQARVEDLRRKSYAGLWGRPDHPETYRLLPNASDWSMWSWRPDQLCGAPLPNGFYLHQGALEVEFPLSTTVQQVDDAVHRAFKERSLAHYLASREGKARLMQLGLDPESRLMTRYTLMEVMDRISVVDELYRFKPRVELPLLIRTLKAGLASLQMPQAGRPVERQAGVSRDR